MTKTCVHLAVSRPFDTILERIYSLQDTCMTEDSDQQKPKSEEVSADLQHLKNAIADLMRVVESNKSHVRLIRGMADSLALYANQVGQDLEIETGLGHVFIIRKEITKKQKN